jgi:hypothetical protein
MLICLSEVPRIPNQYEAKHRGLHNRQLCAWPAARFEAMLIFCIIL